MHAYVIARENTSVGNIRIELHKHLPEYMIPSKMMLIEKMPLNNNGKVERSQLPKMQECGLETYIAPKTEAEKAIAAAFEKYLEVEKVSREDNFYSLGGDSIKAVRVLSGIREQGYEIPLREIIASQKISQMAEKASKMSGGSKEATDELQVKTVALLSLSSYDEEIFKHSDLHQAIYHYDDNIGAEQIVDEVKPFAYQQFFLTEQPDNLCAARAEITGSVSQERVVQICREIIKEQDICRWTYRAESNKFEQYSADEEWNIPYFDISEADCPDEELKLFESIDNIVRCFHETKLLTKLFIVKKEENKHYIYLYAHHAVWDYMSTEVFGSIVKNKCIRKEIPEGTSYLSYTKKRNETEYVDSSEVDTFIHDMKTQVEQYEHLSGAKDYAYTIEAKFRANESVIREATENPAVWGLRLFTAINFGSRDQADHLSIPLILIRFNREQEAMNNLGMYLESLAYCYDCESDNVKPIKNNNYSHIFFGSKHLPEELKKRMFDKVPAINFVTAFDSAYKSEKTDQEVHINKMPQGMIPKGFMSLRIINDMINVSIPCYNNNEEKVKCIFDELQYTA